MNALTPLTRSTDASSRPQPLPEPAAVPEPRDDPYPGAIELHVDARDVTRGIFHVREVLPVASPGRIVLLYPKWLPGIHAPEAPIELFSGLRVSAKGQLLSWTRHPVTVNAFQVDVPVGVDMLGIEFQFLSPTDPAQGRVLCSEAMLCLPWNAVLLYPGGHFARQITMQASLTLPDGWEYACALEEAGCDGATRRFAPVPLDVLVDSPAIAGRHLRRVPLDDAVRLTLVADRPDQLAATPEQLAPYRSLVEQADRLFGARHFDHFDMLLGLSDELTATGIEHHRSFEAVTVADLFTAWDSRFPRRDTAAHEYVHSGTASTAAAPIPGHPVSKSRSATA